MKIIGIVLLCCAILASGQDQGTTSAIDDDDTPTTPSTTTPAPTTSSPATTPTTTAPPKTTTKEPTTPPPTTTTSKPAPAPPAPTPTPTPAPSIPDYPRNAGKWSLEDDKNVSCVALRGAIQLIVVDQAKPINFNVSPAAASSGSCADPQSLVLTWASGVADELNTLTLTFEMNNATKGALTSGNGITNGKFGLQNVTAVLYPLNSTGKPFEKQLVNIATFQTPLKHSYTCLAEEVLKSADGNFSLKIRDVQIEAYRITPPGHREFSTPVQCPADDATDVVPIAVGAALAGLVVIVLIAYLIGRRRSRARGYQSV